MCAVSVRLSEPRLISASLCGGSFGAAFVNYFGLLFNPFTRLYYHVFLVLDQLFSSNAYILLLLYLCLRCCVFLFSFDAAVFSVNKYLYIFGSHFRNNFKVEQFYASCCFLDPPCIEVFHFDSTTAIISFA